MDAAVVELSVFAGVVVVETSPFRRRFTPPAKAGSNSRSTYFTYCTVLVLKVVSSVRVQRDRANRLVTVYVLVRTLTDRSTDRRASGYSHHTRQQA